MPRVYELPTHLEVEDTLIAGLAPRQLVRLAVGGSFAYGLWDQAVWMPLEVRLVLAAALAGAGVLFALFRPGGRPLDQWAIAALLFCLAPRRIVWRPGATPLLQSPRQQTGWAELDVRPEWLGPELPPDLQSKSESPLLPRQILRRSS